MAEPTPPPRDPFGTWLPADDGRVHHYLPGRTIPLCRSRAEATGEPCPQRQTTRPTGRIDSYRDPSNDCPACRAAHGRLWQYGYVVEASR